MITLHWEFKGLCFIYPHLLSPHFPPTILVPNITQTFGVSQLLEKDVVSCLFSIWVWRQKCHNTTRQASCMLLQIMDRNLACPPEGPRCVTGLAGIPQSSGNNAVSDHQLLRLYFLGYWARANFPKQIYAAHEGFPNMELGQLAATSVSRSWKVLLKMLNKGV